VQLRRAATSNADASSDAVRGGALAAALMSVRISAATRVASRGVLAASNKLDKM